MKSRLIFGPAPLYPKVTTATQPHGEITFDVIVSKKGSVEGLTPLSGERLLRDSAANAIREWRFEPYLVNGLPVQVQTIIHVRVDPPAQPQ